MLCSTPGLPAGPSVLSAPARTARSDERGATDGVHSVAPARLFDAWHFVKKQEHRPAIGKGAAGLSRARLHHRIGRVLMRMIFAFAAVAVMALTAPALAQQSANPQQERMKACNTQAGTQHLTGDARKTFMSTCLKGQ
jgi:psiF repeat